ncbi:MAG: hypothetical protein ACLU0O_06375 [Collinsella sp.]
MFGMITALEMVQPRDGRCRAPTTRGSTSTRCRASSRIRRWSSTLPACGARGGVRLICTGISQNTSHMLANAEACDMVLNSEFFLPHKQSPPTSTHGRRCSSSPPRRGHRRRRQPGEGCSSARGSACPSPTTSLKAALRPVEHRLAGSPSARCAGRARRRSNCGSSERGRRDAEVVGARRQDVLTAGDVAETERDAWNVSEEPARSTGGGPPHRRRDALQARRAGRRTRGQIVPTRRRPARGGSDAPRQAAKLATPGRQSPNSTTRKSSRAPGMYDVVCTKKAAGRLQQRKAKADQGSRKAATALGAPKGGVRPRAAGATAAKHQAAQAAAQASGSGLSRRSKGAASAIAGAVSGAAPPARGGGRHRAVGCAPPSRSC